jgi:selenocysteine lyase/cysteine desulfurase
MMNRREFVTASGAVVAGMTAGCGPYVATDGRSTARALFPRLASETFLSGAGGTPLGAFAEQGIRRYLDFVRLGPADGRGEYRETVWNGVRGRFAGLIGAHEDEIGLVECTKAGEQIVIDGLEPLRRGANVVTNDLHFSGSLHNYEGLRRAGVDVRVVRADSDFRVSAERMAEAMDARTALVAVSLVSNVNGHIEPVADIARAAHDRGALVFADIIQAVGAIPIDVEAMGIDVAATSSYKWLFGIHGAGFLYVRKDLQGTTLRDGQFPGHVQRLYEPWSSQREAPGAMRYSAPASAVRYQPGHVSYLGYAAVYEGLGFIESVGGVAAVQRHSTALIARLLERLDMNRYRVITPEPDRAPILSLLVRNVRGLREQLTAAGVVVGVGGDIESLVRVSPAIYNDEADIDRLAAVLHRPI